MEHADDVLTLRDCAGPVMMYNLIPIDNSALIFVWSVFVFSSCQFLQDIVL